MEPITGFPTEREKHTLLPMAYQGVCRRMLLNARTGLKKCRLMGG
jgi:hypothetical protein